MAEVNQRRVIGRKAENGDGVEEEAAVRFNYEYLGGRRKGDGQEEQTMNGGRGEGGWKRGSDWRDGTMRRGFGPKPERWEPACLPENPAVPHFHTLQRVLPFLLN
jgi:hypothetical protein